MLFATLLQCAWQMYLRTRQQEASEYTLFFSPPLPPLLMCKTQQICGRGDTVEALTHVLAQQRRAVGSPRGASAVASVLAGTGHSSVAAAMCMPVPTPQSLSEEDFAKVRAAVLERNGGSKHFSPLGRPIPVSGGVAVVSSPLGGTPVVPSSPSPAQRYPQQHQQKSRWDSCPSGPAGSTTPRSADGKSGGGIDQRLFAPVLRAILAGEGDHVLRRSLLCHPFLKATKSGSTSAGGGGGGGGSSWGSGSLSSKGSSGGASASSPLSGGGRRKDCKGGKGGKAKKRDRGRVSRNPDDPGGQQQGSPSSASSKGRGGGKGGAERPGPLDVSREMGRLADCAAADGSLQSILILVKTLLCAVDPGTKASVLGADSPRRQPQQQSGGRAGRAQAAGTAPSGASLSGGPESRAAPVAEGSSAPSTGLTFGAGPFKALARPGLSGWSDMMEVLRKEKYRERMVALRGRPSLTVCSGKADMRGRLEAKGESAGVVTGVQVMDGKAALRWQDRWRRL